MVNGPRVYYPVVASLAPSVVGRSACHEEEGKRKAQKRRCPCSVFSLAQDAATS